MGRTSLRQIAPWAAAALLLAAAPSSASSLVEVRVGNHPTFTRVVFEFDQPTGYRFERKEAEGTEVLVVTLDGVSRPRHITSRSAGVESVDVSPEGTSRSVARILMRHPERPVREMILSNPPRVVLDVIDEKAEALAREQKARAAAKAKAEPAPSESKSSLAGTEPPAPAPKRAEPAAKPPQRAPAPAVAPKPAPEPEPELEPETVAKAPAPAPAPAPIAKPPAPAVKEPAPVAKPVARKPAPVVEPETPKKSEPAVKPEIAKKPEPVATPETAKKSEAGKPAVKPGTAGAAEPEKKLALAKPPAPAPKASAKPSTRGGEFDEGAPGARGEAPPGAGKPDTAAARGPAPDADEPDALEEPEGAELARAGAPPKTARPSPPAPPAPRPAPPARTAQAGKPAPAPKSSAGGMPFDLATAASIAAGVVAFALLVVFLLRRRRSLPNDLDVTTLSLDGEGVPDDETMEREPASAAAREPLAAPPAGTPAREERAPARPAAPKPAAPKPPDKEDEDEEISLFDDAPRGEPAMMNQEVSDLPASRTDAAGESQPTMAPYASGRGSSPDLTRVVQELERRLAQMETRLDESIEARERLERQVAAQSEELRVQRAAIARTQRALRSLSRSEEEVATEPAPRDPNKPSRS